MFIPKILIKKYYSSLLQMVILHGNKYYKHYPIEPIEPYTTLYNPMQPYTTLYNPLQPYTVL